MPGFFSILPRETIWIMPLLSSGSRWKMKSDTLCFHLNQLNFNMLQDEIAAGCTIQFNIQRVPHQNSAVDFFFFKDRNFNLQATKQLSVWIPLAITWHFVFHKAVLWEACCKNVAMLPIIRQLGGLEIFSITLLLSCQFSMFSSERMFCLCLHSLAGRMNKAPPPPPAFQLVSEDIYISHL